MPGQLLHIGNIDLKPGMLFLVLTSLAFNALHAFAIPPSSAARGPFDLAIANESKVLHMLRKSGKISGDLSTEEALSTLYEILKRRQEHARLMASMPSKNGERLNIRPQGKTLNYLPLQRSLISTKHKQKRPAPLERENYSGPIKTARLLCILMEFPDFLHNALKPGSSDLYYEDYRPAHYTDLLFNSHGYSGPNGETLMSVNRYYEEQSGGSYRLSGTVAGWYKTQQKAAFYGANKGLGGNDHNVRELVKEALQAAEADPLINLADYDVEDRYDLDGDGDLWEADGIIDHLLIIHSTIGEENSGGPLAEDAIWSHHWNLQDVLTFPNSPTGLKHWQGHSAAHTYSIQGIDSAAGDIAHAYAHDLGLNDEYDTHYSGRGEPIAYWSLMARGSKAGLIPGTEPSGFSPWAKELLQNRLGGNWLSGTAIHIDELHFNGDTFLLDQAANKGSNNDVIRIDLPEKEHLQLKPFSGQFAYYSGSGNNLDNAMSRSIDLRENTRASLHFKAWVDSELHRDYAYVLVNGLAIAGNITREDNPNGLNSGSGISGKSATWVDAEFNLNDFAGEIIDLTFYYKTDAHVSNPGMYIDDISLKADGRIIFEDNADAETAFSLAGFRQSTGLVKHPHYYLLEWRTHAGSDKGLKHISIDEQTISTNEGLLVWYVDEYFRDNWVGLHPGEGFLGLVDADQKTLIWSDENTAATVYQIHDAAFAVRNDPGLEISSSQAENPILQDYFTWSKPLFDDTMDFSAKNIPEAGRAITPYGLTLEVLNDSQDGSVGKIRASKNPWFQTW